VDAALKRAAELKDRTPLTFLRRLQDALLRPPTDVPEAKSPNSSSAQPPTTKPKAALGASNEQPASLASRAARAAAWLPGRRLLAAKSSAQASNAGTAAPKGPPPLICMRVEPQDVMMMETVRDRHLKKASPSEATSSGNEEIVESSAGCGANADTECTDNLASKDMSSGQPAATQCTEGCRLLPKLVDVRPISEIRAHGVRGAIGVDVSLPHGTEDFVKWARNRENEVAPFGLQPMHVLLTADGRLNSISRGFSKVL